jgi:SAM-dependent methyltransferase
VAELTDYFAGRRAERYDEEAGARLFAPAVVDPIVDVIAKLAGDGAALELGIGTGRIALPLKQRGIRVSGIDLSPDMVAQLRKKPGSEDIDVAVGDFSTTAVDGAFAVAYIVANTFMNLTTQEAQVSCFRNVAAHLEPGGCFAIDVVLPDLQRLPYGETFRPFHIASKHIGIDEYDVANQGLISHHYYPGENEMVSIPFRYIWPAELDLMAQLAGMRVRERWSDWKQTPFTSESMRLVGFWEKTS